jgi:hypothetical protein
MNFSAGANVAIWHRLLKKDDRREMSGGERESLSVEARTRLI